MRASLTLALAPLLVGAAPADPHADVTFKPVVEGGAVTAVDVTMTLDSGPADGFAMTAPIVYPGAPGVADRMTAIALTDAGGTVATTTRDDPAVPGGFPYFRHWKAERAVQYPLTLKYRAAVMAPGGAGGPAFGIRAVAGGVVGAGSGMLIVPDGDAYKATTLRWDLSALPAGAIASTTLGDGNIVQIKGGPDEIQQSWILAGPAQRYPASGTADGFSAAWLGTPTFDAAPAMAMTAKGHAWLGHYFPHLKPTPPYRVFMQFRDQPPYGGATALGPSFMLARGPLKQGEKAEAPLTTIFHEMIHQWVGGIEAPQGESSWFAEGLTSYYQDLLAMKGGFISVADYEKAINGLAEDYFTSKARNWSAAEITKVGFGDEEIRHTPYRRSAMYLYDLDARIRAKSGGKRTLNSIMFPMFLAREKGERFDTARWVAMVTAELGAGEKERFERLILQGADTLEPRPDAFGPCFTREATVFQHDGKAIPGYKWVRVAKMPDSTCRGR